MANVPTEAKSQDRSPGQASLSDSKAPSGAGAAGKRNARQSDPLGISRLFGRLLIPLAGRPALLLEVVLIMLLAIGLFYVLQPGDPLLLDNPFPWIWLLPTIVALRYGALLGVVSGICLFAAWEFFYRQHAGGAFPTMLFVGGFTQVVVAGHFCDLWASRAVSEKSINAYLRDRLVSITNNHYLLRISHAKLENDFLSRPTTFRDAIEHLRALAEPVNDAEQQLLPNAQSMLEFVALTCQIEVAAIYPVRDGMVAAQPVAYVGHDFELDSHSPVLRHCLVYQELSHLKDMEDEEAQDQYLACAPIVDASERMLGVLVISRMPFLALNFDNLQLLLALLNYYAFGVSHKATVDVVRNLLPDCPYSFSLELGRLSRLKSLYGIQSAMLGLAFPPGDEGELLFNQAMRLRRALDSIWTPDVEGRHVMIVLMPLTSAEGVEGYLERFRDVLKEQFAVDLDSALTIRSKMVDGDDPGHGLQKLLQHCQHHG
nr:PelD GGDEF domain-containing protein [Chromobacterium sp. ASV5]